VIKFTFCYAFFIFASQHCGVHFRFWLSQITKSRDISVFINQSSFILYQIRDFANECLLS